MCPYFVLLDEENNLVVPALSLLTTSQPALCLVLSAAKCSALIRHQIIKRILLPEKFTSFHPQNALSKSRRSLSAPPPP